MTFEQKFILKCLNLMDKILSDRNEIAKAVSHFTQDQTITARYQLNSKITDSKNWDDQDKLHLSAAVFEAILRSSLHFYAENTDLALEINTASSVFLDTYLPKITARTNPIQRLESIRNNIAQIKAKDFTSPYSFFPPVTTGLIVLAAAAAVALAISRS